MTGYNERILALLEPEIGHSLAVSVIRTKCGDLGIQPGFITADMLPALADELYEPLRIFRGEKFAQVMTDRIRALAP